MLRIIFLWLAMLFATLAAPGHACSVIAEYVRPSNFELVQLADAIVIATPESQAGDMALTFRVQSVVKGAPPDRITMAFAAFGATGPSNLENLSASHPEGHAGPCNRSTFAHGGRYLLFLERAADGRWQVLDHPFSRVSEDYAGEDNAWMRAVRRYLRVQRSQQPMQQIDALRRMAETGRDGAPLAAAERADIVDHLGSISPWKPTAWLLDIYGRLERRESLPFQLRPAAANGEAGNLDEVAAFLLGERPAPSPPEAERARQLVLQSLVRGSHPDALPLFEHLSQAGDVRVVDRALALRFFAANGQYSRAYLWIEANLMNLLPRLEVREQRSLIGAIAEVQRGPSYEEGQERWRRDPHAAATWPELALALHWYQQRAFGPGDGIGFSDAIAAIPVRDYRARPPLTIALGDSYDEAVERWAMEQLRNDVRASGNPDSDADLESDPAMLPLRVLAGRWSAERYDELDRLVCLGGRRRVLLISALGLWGDELYESLLGEIAATTDISDDERDLLRRAALGFMARAAQGQGLMRWEGVENGSLLARLMRGERSGGEPRRCPRP